MSSKLTQSSRSPHKKGIKYGFALPITYKAVKSIKGARWVPLNIIGQQTIDEYVKRTPKHRITHNQSFEGISSSISINDQADYDQLEPIIYGFMFIWAIHMIHAMRMTFPTTPILLYKFYLKASYQRLHMVA